MTVGLGYLTLDRQSRTLSGGEVQRINLTTALGTSLVNTLFVLDEPSVGPPRARHGAASSASCTGCATPATRCWSSSTIAQVMEAADRILDMGPGPGEDGGQDHLLRHARRSRRAPRTRSPAPICAASGA